MKENYQPLIWMLTHEVDQLNVKNIVEIIKRMHFGQQCSISLYHSYSFSLFVNLTVIINSHCMTDGKYPYPRRTSR